MEIDPNIWEQMEAYLDGRLEKGEREKLEKEIAADPKLQKALEDLRALMAGIEKTGQKQMRAQIAQWEAQALRNQEKKHAPPYLKWAAAILVLIAGGYFVYLSLAGGETIEKQSLAESMFSPYPNLRAERGMTGSTMIDSILSLYEAGKYGAAAKGFTATSRPESESADMWDFYKAESLIASGEFVKGADILSAFADRGHALFETARFHRALALVMAGENEEAKDLLTLISMEKGPYREKANAVLEDLNLSEE